MREEESKGERIGEGVKKEGEREEGRRIKKGESNVICTRR